MYFVLEQIQDGKYMKALNHKWNLGRKVIEIFYIDCRIIACKYMGIILCFVFKLSADFAMALGYFSCENRQDPYVAVLTSVVAEDISC